MPRKKKKNIDLVNVVYEGDRLHIRAEGRGFSFAADVEDMSAEALQRLHVAVFQVQEQLGAIVAKAVRPKKAKRK
jgi:hypothetical protein